jgi:hypothetical protein
MARGAMKIDQMTLKMALAGFEIERGRLEEKIRELKLQLKGKSAPADAEAPAAAPGKRRKRKKMSAASRARIAAAQKKRWAEYHKQHAKAS